MLKDYRQDVEQFAEAAKRQKAMLVRYGKYLETLAPWYWFMTITARDSPGCGAPSREWAHAELLKYFDQLRREAGQPIAWVLAEDFGNATGRFHAHALVAGVEGVPMHPWWTRAFNRLGRTKIEPFE